MTLLQEIIDAASGSDVSVPTLLRKVKVLAARTGTSASLGLWVDQELNGYDTPETVPSYRGPHTTPVLGDFFGVMGSGVKNMPIPPISFPEDLRDGPLFSVTFMQPLAEIEDLARQTTVQFVWPPDAITYYNHGVSQGIIHRIVRDDMVLAQVTRPISRSILTGIIDSVRTRVLDLALNIESVAPEAGEPNSTEGTRRDAQQVLNTYNFYGAGSNIAIGSQNVVQTVTPPAPGDLDGLMRYLGAAGIPPAELVLLQTALEEDAESGEDGPEGSRVKAWLARATGGFGTEVVASGAAALVIEALKAYFGS